MTDQKYAFLRKLFFWFFLLAFIISTPVIISYSLGYQLDFHSRKFQKAGALSIKCVPKETNVFIDGAKVSDTTPYMSRNLLPRLYSVTLQKENFYPYQLEANIQSSLVTEIDVALIPHMQQIERLLPNFNVYKFFIIPQLFGKKILLFTDKGLYETGETLENPQKIANLSLEDTTIATINGLKENKNFLVFWSQYHIWLVALAKPKELEANELGIYKNGEMIRDVFWGMKGRYVIVHDALKIFALDIKNPSVSFPLFTANSLLASAYYDSDADILYVRDRLPNSEKFSLFRISLTDVINEKTSN